MATFGFIGTGNMGGALVKAVAKTVPPTDIMIANRTRAKADALAREVGCRVCHNADVCWSDFIFLGVKPVMIGGVIDEIRDDLTGRDRPAVLVSMAAAVSIDDIADMLGADYPIIRIMPNTPVSVGEGVILYTPNAQVSARDEEEFVKALSFAGKCVKIEEKLMDPAGALSGCGPAFVDLFMESLADGAVACGVPRATAVELAARTLMGSAKLLIESGKNPGQLKDEVCSPGGTTIAGVRVLEESAFRAASMNAVIAAYDKTLALKKK